MNFKDAREIKQIFLFLKYVRTPRRLVSVEHFAYSIFGSPLIFKDRNPMPRHMSLPVSVHVKLRNVSDLVRAGGWLGQRQMHKSPFH